jgi:long-chain acyl-CoA synthetase
MLLKLAPRLAPLKVVVSIDEISDETRHALNTWAGEQGIKIFSLLERKWGSFGT